MFRFWQSGGRDHHTFRAAQRISSRVPAASLALLASVRRLGSGPRRVEDDPVEQQAAHEFKSLMDAVSNDAAVAARRVERKVEEFEATSSGPLPSAARALQQAQVFMSRVERNLRSIEDQVVKIEDVITAVTQEAGTLSELLTGVTFEGLGKLKWYLLGLVGFDGVVNGLILFAAGVGGGLRSTIVLAIGAALVLVLCGTGAAWCSAKRLAGGLLRRLAFASLIALLALIALSVVALLAWLRHGLG